MTKWPFFCKDQGCLKISWITNAIKLHWKLGSVLVFYSTMPWKSLTIKSLH